jgi:ClpP class serine protease
MLPTLLREPWAISESGMQLVLAVATRDEFFAEVRDQALAARNGEPMKNTRTVERTGPVAVIPVKGPLFKHAPLLAAISGATDYGVIRKDLQAALDDPSIEAILLDVDSPGGEVNGCAELAQAIYDARGKKKIEAYVGGSGASAAFWLASAASRVTVASTAMVGSIGVLASFTWKDEQGAKKLDIVSSQSPNKLHDPATEGGRALLQARVDDLAEVFIANVAKHRGVTPEQVAADYGQGGVFVGAKAFSAGLADAVGTYETVLASLASAPPRERPMFTTRIAAAFGLSAEATEDQLLAVATALASSQREMLAATGTATIEEARGKIIAGSEALEQLEQLRGELATAKADGIRRDLRATLELGLKEKRLSLGAIQTTVPLFVANEEKRAEMLAAFDKLEEKKRETAADIIEAACSVDIAAGDLRAIASYAKSAAPSAVEPVKAPERTDAEDAAELDEVARKIKKGADGARAVLARGTTK